MFMISFLSRVHILTQFSFFLHNGDGDSKKCSRNCVCFFFFRGKVSARIDKDLQSSFSTQNCRLRIRDWLLIDWLRAGYGICCMGRHMWIGKQETAIRKIQVKAPPYNRLSISQRFIKYTHDRDIFVFSSSEYIPINQGWLSYQGFGDRVYSIFVRDIISIAHMVKVIETPADRDSLRVIRCDPVGGFYTAPHPAKIPNPDLLDLNMALLMHLFRDMKLCLRWEPPF